MATAVKGEVPERLALLRVLGPGHVWALGVGIVLVGEFMGWNFSVAKGGALRRLIACWVIGLLYTCVAMIDSEVTSTVAAAGGQYAQAKHIDRAAHGVQRRPLPGHGLHDAGGRQRHHRRRPDEGRGGQTGYEGLDGRPFIVLTIALLAWLNYRGVFMTLTVNFVITAIAFLSIVVLFIGVSRGTRARSCTIGSC